MYEPDFWVDTELGFRTHMRRPDGKTWCGNPINRTAVNPEDEAKAKKPTRLCHNCVYVMSANANAYWRTRTDILV